MSISKKVQKNILLNVTNNTQQMSDTLILNNTLSPFDGESASKKYATHVERRPAMSPSHAYTQNILARGGDGYFRVQPRPTATATTPTRRINQRMNRTNRTIRTNMTLIQDPNAPTGFQTRTARTRAQNLTEQLRSMFNTLGFEFSAERRDNKYVNPITQRTITVRNEADIKRLKTRMLARTRNNRAAQQQQERVTRAEDVLRSAVLRFRRQRELELNARTSTLMDAQRTEISYDIPPRMEHADLLINNPEALTAQFLIDEMLPVIKKTLSSQISQNGPQKVFLRLECIIFQPVYEEVDGRMVDVSPHLSTMRNNQHIEWNSAIIDSISDHGVTARWFSTAAETRIVPGSIDTFIRRSLRDIIKDCISGWSQHSYVHFMGFRQVSLIMMDSNPLAGSHVAIPKWLANKKAVINIQNKDNRCFGYALAAAKQQLTKDRPTRAALYEPDQHVTIPNGCSYPVGLADIARWESANKINISVYSLPSSSNEGSEKDQSFKILPMHVSNTRYKETAQLLEYNGHYMWIKNWERLFSSGGDKGKHKYVCKCCLQSFTKKDCLERHVIDCGSSHATKEQLPKPGENMMEFKGPKLSQVRHPLALYYDFESKLKKVERETEQETDENNEMAWTKIVHEHVPISWRIHIECTVPLPFDIDLDYVGEGAATEFIKKLMNIEDLLHKHLFPPSKKERERFENEGGLLAGRPAAPMIISAKQEADFQSATCCHLCGGGFDDESDINKRKVRDHDHYTGQYRGCAHSCCNLHLVDSRQARSIPVIAHFGSRYDTHLIIKEAYNVLRKKDKLDVLATNSEQFKTFSIRGLKFIDSGAFMGASLASILDSMSDDQKPRLRSISPEHFDLVKAKGLFPYEWFDDEARLDEEVPMNKEAWWSNTRLEGISDKDLELVQRVITAFNIKTFREWHDLYLKIDVMGLADAFESFRDFSLREWGLDPVGYLGLPGLAWDGLKLQQKKKGAKPVELFTDPDMYRFCERGIRGGICHVAKRYSKSEMPELPGWNDDTQNDDTQNDDETLKDDTQNDDETQVKMQKQSLDLDANNLYGHSMVQKLPHSDFEWLNDSEDMEYVKEKIKTYLDTDWEDSDDGYIVEVDLDYPKEYHDAHSDYPLAPEKKCVDQKQVSSYCHEYNKKYSRNFTSSSKLMCHLGGRNRYVVHAKTLGLYLRLGMKLKKIHRALSFHQEAWMADWINDNTSKRAKAQTEFERDLFKLANNACFGKTMENVRGRMNLKLCFDPDAYKRYINRTDYLNDFQIAGNDDNALMAINMREKTVKLDKPIFAGLAVLDLSKHWMYHSYYNVFKPMFGPTMRLGATDTDSFMIDVTGDVDAIIWKNREHFDLHNYPENHPLYDTSNKKILGKFKNELAGEIIAERVNLRAKLYSFNVFDPKTGHFSSEKKCKGISKAVVKKSMHFEDYKQTLMQQSRQYRTQYMLRSKNHTIYTVCINKVALSSYDDKRYILDEGLDSLAYGHWRIEEIIEKEKALRAEVKKHVDAIGGKDYLTIMKHTLQGLVSQSLGYHVEKPALNRMLEAYY